MPTDWEGRYQEGDTPWDKGEASPGLVDYLAAHPKMPRGTVLIPGCGLGYDARVWAGAGFTATGYDIAPSAVAVARKLTAAAGLKAEFALGDFLVDAPPHPFDWVFEHTLFCAIDVDRRRDYVEALLLWLKPSGYYLAVNYLIADKDGPPFGTSRAELMDRFSKSFALLEEWVPRSYPNRAGLELMFLWQKR